VFGPRIFRSKSRSTLAAYST